MRVRLSIVALLVMCGFGLWLGMAEPAVAQGYTNNSAVSGPLMTVGGSCERFGGSKAVYAGKIVPCIAATIEQATVKLTIGMMNIMRPIFWAFLTLVITFFGVKILQGEGNIDKHAMLLLVKIAFVIGFLNLTVSLIPVIYDVMKEAQETVTSAIAPTNTNAAGFTVINPNAVSCDIQNYMNNNGDYLWAQMDCLLGKIMGFAVGSGGGPNMVLMASILGTVGGFFFGGSFGLAVFFACVGFLIALMMLVVRTVFAFLNGYLLVAIHLIIAPIFLPMVLLQATTPYFDKWWKGLLGGMIMPIIVTAYSVIALFVLDKAIFADNSALQNLFKETTQQFSQLPKQEICMPATTNNEAGRLPDIQTAVSAANVGNVQFQTGKGYCFDQSAVWRPDLRGMEPKTEKFNTTKDVYTKLLKEFVMLFVLCFIIMEAYDKMISKLLGALSGSGLAGVAMSKKSKMQSEVEREFRETQQQMYQTVGDKQGADLLNALNPEPPAPMQQTRPSGQT